VIVANGINSGLFMVVPNRTGAEGALSFYGSSFISDPYGRVLVQAPRDQEAVLVADLDLDQRRDWLELFPFLLTRRPDTYGALTDRWTVRPYGRVIGRPRWSNERPAVHRRYHLDRFRRDGCVVGGRRNDRCARPSCPERSSAATNHVDLGGGFLMPSFGDGHAHRCTAVWRRSGRRCGRAGRWTKSCAR
jgi:hypothetical protein